MTANFRNVVASLVQRRFVSGHASLSATFFLCNSQRWRILSHVLSTDCSSLPSASPKSSYFALSLFVLFTRQNFRCGKSLSLGIVANGGNICPPQMWWCILSRHSLTTQICLFPNSQKILITQMLLARCLTRLFHLTQTL